MVTVQCETLLLDILLRVNAEGILSVSVSVGDCRFAVPPNPGMVRIRVGFMDCRESSRTAGSATSQPPVLLSSTEWKLLCCFDHKCFRQSHSTWSDFFCWFQAGALHRFMRGTDRSPDWVRLLSDCLGRTGRHRRTGGNRSVPSLIPPYISNRLSLEVTDCQVSEWLLSRRFPPRDSSCG